MPTVSHAGRLAAGLLLLTLLASACSGTPARSAHVTQGPANDPDAIVIRNLDDYFEPNVIEVEAGTEVAIEIRGEGRRPHNFVIPALDLATSVMGPGTVETARFTVPDGGVEFVCTLHRAMRGRIVTPDQAP